MTSTMTNSTITKTDLINLSDKNFELLQTLKDFIVRIEEMPTEKQRTLNIVPSLDSIWYKSQKLSEQINQDLVSIENTEESESPVNFLRLKQLGEARTNQLLELISKLEKSCVFDPEDNYKYLFKKIKLSCSESHYPLEYLSDKRLKDSINELNAKFELLNTSLLQKIFAEEATEDTYKTGVNLLENFQNQNQHLLSKIQQRYKEVKAIHNSYEKRIKLKISSITKLRKLVNEAKQLTTTPEDNKYLKEVVKNINKIEKKTYIKNAVNFEQRYQDKEQQNDMKYLTQTTDNLKQFIKTKTETPVYQDFKDQRKTLAKKADALINKATGILDKYKKLKSQNEVKKLYSDANNKTNEMKAKKESYIPTIHQIRAGSELFMKDHEDLKKLINSLEEICNDVEQEKSATQQKIAQVTEKINTQIELFKTRSKNIIRRLAESKLNDSKIQKIIEQFNQKNIEGIKVNETMLDYLEKKLAALVSIVKKLDALVLKEEIAISNEQARIAKEVTAAKIADVVTAVEKHRLIYINKVKQGNYRFSDSETELFNQLKLLKVTDDKYKTQDTLSGLMDGALSDAQKQAQEFEELAKDFDQVLTRHQEAKLTLENQNSIELIIGLVNIKSSEEAISFLNILSRYKHSLLYKLNDNKNIIELDLEGRANLEEFIKQLANPEVSITTEIQEKLKIISILSNNNISAKDYLDKPVAMKTALLLNEKNLDKLITEKNLDNDNFNEALKILEAHQLGFDENTVIALAEDVNKCQLLKVITDAKWLSSIVPVEALEDEDTVKKEILSILIATKPEITDSINILSTKQPNFCQPWLFKALENSELKLLLSKPQQIAQALPFLEVMFNRGICNSLSLAAKDRDEYSVFDNIFKIERNIEKTGNFTLKSHLVHLNRAMEGIEDFDKISQIMSTLNRFFRQNHVGDNHKVDAFCQLALPVLLTVEGPEASFKNKQQKLCELAHTVFPPTGWGGFKDTLISIINSAFAKVSDKYKCGFFKRVETDTTKNLRENIRNALTEIKADDAKQEENDSEVPEEESLDNILGQPK